MPAFDQLSLTTARLRLRPLAAGDADSLYAIFSDPVVMRYWSTPPWASHAQAHEMIANDAVELHAGAHLRLALIRKADAALVGTCSLFALHAASRRAEIGYALARSAWGTGLMAEALDALVAHAFGELQLNRIEADIDPRNTASAKSLARIGFVNEGLFRERWIVAGEVSDAAMYGLLRSEWRPTGAQLNVA
jgi:RimJ/RimL family protein N-acetyltransferase